MENLMLRKKVLTKNNHNGKPVSAIDRNALLKMEQAELRIASNPNIQLLKTDYLE